MERASFEQWKPREVARLLALVETERRYYQEMVAELPVALAVLAPDRAIMSSNRAMRRLVGLSGEDLRQKNIEQILPSDELIERIRSAHVHGDTTPFSISLGDRNFRIAAVPIRGWEEEMQSETLLMIEAAEPVAAPPSPAATEPKASEPSQPESQTEPTKSEPVPSERAKAAPEADLSGVPAAVWQANASTFAFTFVTGAVEEILGYSASHWLAEPLFFTERIHPDDREDVMAHYRGADSGEQTAAEFRAIGASGETVWLRETIRVTSVGEDNRQISGVTTIIGERRQLETQSLEAGRVDALRGLAGRVAHELNNPLMIVTGYGEELLHGFKPDDPRHADVEELLAATGRLAEMTGSLLAFTRPQAREASIVSLTEVLGGLEARLKGVTGKVDFAFPGGSVWACANADQLDEAIAALTAFAIDHTNDISRLSITCHTATVAERTGGGTLEPGAYARLDLHAVGQGVQPALAPFESILSPKDARKTAGPNVTRAYLNIRQWGGDIVFTSDAAHGTSFAVYLPYAEAPYIEPVPVPRPALEPVFVPPPPSVPEPAEAALATIMLVEDEPGIRGLVRKILRRERYDVLEAGTGEEAIAIASNRDVPIDLLLTDVVLPGMSGRDLAESLSATHPSLKVVYISGFTDDEKVRSGDFPPGSQFLQKPFTLSALLNVVKDSLTQ